MPIDRSQFTPDGSNPPWPVVISADCTVPTEDMAVRLADLLNTKGFVLEIGTGSGYQTAILAERCAGVLTVEVDSVPGVANKLPENVAMLIDIDGINHDTGEQFDGILVTFASPGVSPAWAKQLKVGARLVMPWATGINCPVCVFEKQADDSLHLLEIPLYAPFTGAVEGLKH